ncbi:hypothetical protein CBR_g55034 [Chara braunii]|uniref:RRM domain-containing protein n=1 Tax=Chara braunii TaxID=69332 RepID=A0A388MCP1_CHABU|nr:hypothetical protein CBR_g55034 [Chara braunii]|eukprot:GBG92265.1 hypothetical protein CBR_g55034 [Chara braunii]
MNGMTSDGEDAPVGSRKLVVLGLPWETNTEALKQYMSKFGDLDDVVVMKDRATGRSRGFGYVTFSNATDAEKVVQMKHELGGRNMEVKVATPKEEMKSAVKQGITRIFVARIPHSIDDDSFRAYFEKYGNVTDAYMPKDHTSKQHRGIGFITFDNPEAVDKVMKEIHELGGQPVAIDRAQSKEESYGRWGPGMGLGMGLGMGMMGMGMGGMGRFGWGGTGVMGSYDSYGSTDGPTAYDPTLGQHVQQYSSLPLGGVFGGVGGTGGALGGRSMDGARGGLGSQGMLRGGVSLGPKIFVGRLPAETTSEDLRRYFNNFGRIADVYLPKDPKKNTHRGFGFVTFETDAAAERVAARSHEIHGQPIAVDRASPRDDVVGGASAVSLGTGGVVGGTSTGGAGGPLRNTSIGASAYGSVGAYGTLGSSMIGQSSWDGSTGAYRSSRAERSYKPY